MRLSLGEKLTLGTIITYLMLLGASIIGWVANIVQIVVMITHGNPNIALLAVKCVGAIVAPLGALLGWVGFFV